MRVMMVGVKPRHADEVRQVLRREFFAPAVLQIATAEEAACATLEIEPDVVIAGTELDVDSALFLEMLADFGHDGLFGVIVEDIDMFVEADFVLPEGFGPRACRRAFLAAGMFTQRRKKAA